MTEEEKRLINIAQYSLDDNEANAAMEELRRQFDSSYGWCSDCDDLVTTELMCCMNIKTETEDGEQTS